MTTSLRDFDDLADKRFFVAEPVRPCGICSPLRMERGTRSFAISLVRAGIMTFGDLHEKAAIEVVMSAASASPSKGPTTRKNFDAVLGYLLQNNVRLG